MELEGSFENIIKQKNSEIFLEFINTFDIPMMLGTNEDKKWLFGIYEIYNLHLHMGKAWVFGGEELQSKAWRYIKQYNLLCVEEFLFWLGNNDVNKPENVEVWNWFFEKCPNLECEWILSDLVYGYEGNVRIELDYSDVFVENNLVYYYYHYNGSRASDGVDLTVCHSDYDCYYRSTTLIETHILPQNIDYYFKTLKIDIKTNEKTLSFVMENSPFEEQRKEAADLLITQSRVCNP